MRRFLTASTAAFFAGAAFVATSSSAMAEVIWGW